MNETESTLLDKDDVDLIPKNVARSAQFHKVLKKLESLGDSNENSISYNDVNEALPTPSVKQPSSMK